MNYLKEMKKVGKATQVTADFFPQTMETRKRGNNIFEVLREGNIDPEMMEN